MFDSIYSPPQPSVIRQYIKVKRSQANRLTPSFPPVGVTGFEPATTRPPDAYSNRAELHPELRMQRYCFILNLQVFCAILFMPIL